MFLPVKEALLSCLVLCAILDTPAASAAPVSLQPKNKPFHVTTFGTSLTARGGWQTPLKNRLEGCLGRAVKVTNLAQVGRSSVWGLANIGLVAAENPDVVIIEFAINDAALDRFISIAESRSNLTEMIRKTKSLEPAARIYLQAMSPVWGLRGWMRPFLNSYVEDHKALASELQIGFIDHREFWRTLSEPQVRELIPDGSHPLPDRTAGPIADHIATHICVDFGSIDPNL